MSGDIMRTRRRWGRSAILGTIGGLAVASAAAAGGLVPEDVGPAVDEGSVVIAAPDGTPLASGGSATPYTLVLPEGSTCPGDSANDDWRVQTFLIPASHDPGQVEYGVIGPEGTQFPLFAFDTKPYAHQLLPVNAGPGMEARIPLLPELTFTIFPPDAVAPGRYRIGVAHVLPPDRQVLGRRDRDRGRSRRRAGAVHLDRCRCSRRRDRGADPRARVSPLALHRRGRGAGDRPWRRLVDGPPPFTEPPFVHIVSRRSTPMNTNSFARRRALLAAARGGAVLSAAMLAISVVGAFGASAEPLVAGAPATEGLSISVESGNSSTPFSLALAAPNNVCPGDSAVDGYRWHNFLVSDDVDVAVLKFNASGPIAPAGSKAFPLLKRPAVHRR
ncbi:MAG: hypothetical protein R2713_14015 [Ilumatobacteraceae bacterium]